MFLQSAHQTLINHFMKYIKYAMAGVIFFLLTITVYANSYIYPYNHTIKKLSGLHEHQDQPRLFLIAVVDTQDEIIGARCEADLDDITDTFDNLADWLGVEMPEPKIIKGDEFSKAAVNDAIGNWLASQQLTQSDIVVFYYSGHGFRYKNDAGDYPRMWLKTANDKNIETNNLRIQEDVYDRITQMGAGVNIILSDCCNTIAANGNANFNDATVPVRQHVKRQKQSADASEEDDYGDKLFIPGHPLSILATAAEKDEYAGGKEDVGGFFTYYLIEALEDCIYDNKIEPLWGNIFNYADKNAGYWAKSAACPDDAKHNDQGRCLQTARFKIE